MRADKLLEKRMKRSVAIILRVKDEAIDPLLELHGDQGRAASAKLRKAVLDVFNDFCDVAKDIAMSGESSTVWFNEETFDARMQQFEQRVLSAIQGDDDGAERS